MPRHAAETRGRQRPRDERPWPDVEAMAPRSRLRGRAPDRAAAAGCTTARGRGASTGSLPARAWTGGRGVSIERVALSPCSARCRPRCTRPTRRFSSPRRPGALLTIRREALAPRAPLDWHPSAEGSTRRVISKRNRACGVRWIVHFSTTRPTLPPRCWGLSPPYMREGLERLAPPGREVLQSCTRQLTAGAAGLGKAI